MGEARRKRLAAAATETASTGATAAEVAIVRHVLVMDATPGPYRTEGDRMSWHLELAGGCLVAGQRQHCLRHPGRERLRAGHRHGLPRS